MRLLQRAPGLCLVAALAWAAAGLSKLAWFSSHGLGALTVAMLLGIAIGNVFHRVLAVRCEWGVTFSKQRLLRIGVVLYGFRLTFQDLHQIGLAGVAADAAILGSTFLIATVTGVRVFGLDRGTAMLVGAGSSICGAAAVMATGPVVKASGEQVAVAVATVVTFGTLGMFLYPAAYAWALQHAILKPDERAYGLFVGSSVHEVAQVMVAGAARGEGAADAAVIAKMVRVLMLGPFLLCLAAWLSRQPACGPVARVAVIPWFVLGFIAVVGVNSMGIVPAGARAGALDLSTVLLSMAMCALGISTRIATLRRAGPGPMALAGLLFVWLTVGGLAINWLAAALMG